MTNRSQIVATIGPASKDVETIKKMIAEGMGVARLNFSWGTHEEHAVYITDIRAAALELGRRVPIIQDLSGPRIQNGRGHEYNESAIEVVTEKDIVDLRFGIEQNVDYVALSYVGDKGDVLKLRDEMQKAGKLIPIIAKIERQKAIDNLDEIIETADAVMVARGDLGNEIPLEQIPFAEKDIIEKCNKAGKPVITATQMLLSMTENPYPTRAEVTDVAYAIVCGSDGVMLSEESASGKYPVEAVMMMNRVVLEAGKHKADRSPNSF
jgi:pyruvate kinase